MRTKNVHIKGHDFITRVLRSYTRTLTSALTDLKI